MRTVVRRSTAFTTTGRAVVYHVFDLMILGGVDVRREPLERRRLLLEKKVLPKLSEPARYTASLDAPLSVLIESVKALSAHVLKPSVSRFADASSAPRWDTPGMRDAVSETISRHG